jgi:hypothetical protein
VEQDIRENLKTVYLMVVEFIFTQTEVNMKVNGKTVKKREKVFQH